MNWKLGYGLIVFAGALFLATGTAQQPASARNVDDYQCGKIKLTVSVIKDNGTPVGYSTEIERKNLHQKSSGRVIFDRYMEPTHYVLGRKKIKCKMLPEDQQKGQPMTFPREILAPH